MKAALSASPFFPLFLFLFFFNQQRDAPLPATSSGLTGPGVLNGRDSEPCATRRCFYNSEYSLDFFFCSHFSGWCSFSPCRAAALLHCKQSSVCSHASVFFSFPFFFFSFPFPNASHSSPVSAALSLFSLDTHPEQIRSTAQTPAPSVWRRPRPACLPGSFAPERLLPKNTRPSVKRSVSATCAALP